MSRWKALLDSGCNIEGIINNPSIAINGRKAKAPVRVSGIGGSITCTEVADHRDLVPGLLIAPNAPANIFGLSAIAKRHWVYHDQEHTRFLVITSPNRVYVYREEQGLYAGSPLQTFTLKKLGLKLPEKYYTPFLEYMEQQRRAAALMAVDHDTAEDLQES